MSMWNIPAQLGAWDQVSNEIENELQKSGCPPETVVSIIAAADEIFANISSYAYQSKDGQVEIKTKNVSLDTIHSEYSLTFADRGAKFNPLDAPTYEKGTLAQRKYKTGIQGGFGIHIVKDKADKLSYKYTDGQNILCFMKFYKPIKNNI